MYSQGAQIPSIHIQSIISLMSICPSQFFAKAYCRVKASKVEGNEFLLKNGTKDDDADEPCY